VTFSKFTDYRFYVERWPQSCWVSWRPRWIYPSDRAMGKPKGLVWITAWILPIFLSRCRFDQVFWPVLGISATAMMDQLICWF